MLSKQTTFNLKNYNALFIEGHTNYAAQGGVATFFTKVSPTKK